MSISGGKPLTVIAGTSDNKSKRDPQVGQLSVDDLSQLQVEIDASNHTMNKIMTTIRKRIGFKAIEKNANQGLLQAGRRVEDFYAVKKIPMEVKESVDCDEKGKSGKRGEAKGAKAKGKSKKKTVTVKEEKDVVFVRDVAKFVDFVIKERGLNPARTTVRIGLDGGQDTFKVMASIFDDAEDAHDNDDNDDDAAENCAHGKDSPRVGNDSEEKPKAIFKPKLNSG